MRPLGAIVAGLMTAAGCVPEADPDQPGTRITCESPDDIIEETDLQAYLLIDGAFDRLLYDDGSAGGQKMTHAIDEYLRSEICRQRLGGAVLGVVWQRNMAYAKGYGLARGFSTQDDDDDDVKVRATFTFMRWGSVSKSVTAVAAQRAVNDPAVLLDIDADLRDTYRGCDPETGSGCAFDLPTT